MEWIIKTVPFRYFMDSWLFMVNSLKLNTRGLQLQALCFAQHLAHLVIKHHTIFLSLRAKAQSQGLEG